MTKTSGRGKMSLMEADSILKSLWDQDAAAWDRHWVPVFALFAKDLVAEACPSSGDNVLDLGTGTGLAAIHVCKTVPSVTLVVGVDRSEAMVRLACKKAVREDLPNVRFLKMAGEDLQFPDDFFDVVISNCGIGISRFTDGLREILRVLRPGGILVFNDWHLIDVKPHQLFSEILGKYRNKVPSSRLALERTALATMESFHRSLSPNTQKRMVRQAGFTKAIITHRNYKVRMRSLEDYLMMRLTRATIQREISEIPPPARAMFHADLKASLRQFLLKQRFAFDWHVFYIRAQKKLKAR